MNYIGIDNGVSGAISVITKESELLCFELTPIKRCLDYTKKAQYLNRIDINKIYDILYGYKDSSKCLMERPMISPMRFKASISAIRALEATLIVLDELKIPYEYIDSKEWQRSLLPSGIYKNYKDKSGKNRMKADKEELKKASHDIALRIFPHVKLSEKQDGDALLIAEYLRKKELGIL